RLTADSGIAANPAVAAAKANCVALSHPIAASNCSTPPGSCRDPAGLTAQI
ncbi:hypothetical protein A2U01_0108677, partial [Trifolium medium]|nr:hypothetical protein [Trifolium medium]